mgnify:CR=1 FL=1
MPAGVDARLGAVLAQRGIAQLYSHQAEAYERIAAGENIVIVTPTASGKTPLSLALAERHIRDLAASLLKRVGLAERAWRLRLPEHEHQIVRGHGEALRQGDAMRGAQGDQIV